MRIGQYIQPSSSNPEQPLLIAGISSRYQVRVLGREVTVPTSLLMVPVDTFSMAYPEIILYGM